MFKKIIILTITSLFILSCGEPNNPEDYSGGYKVANKIATFGDANDVIVDGNYAYVAQGEVGLAIFDISNPKNPTLVTNQSVGLKGYSTKLLKKDNIIYLAAGGSGFNIVDITDLNNIQVNNQNINGKLVNVHLMGNYLVSSLSETGIQMVNIENPIFIDYRGKTQTNGFVRDVITSNDQSKMFAATGEMGLSLFDISVFDDGYGVYPLLSSVNLPGYAESVVLDETNQKAYVACGNAGLQVVDYSNPNSIKLIGSYDSAGYAKEIAYENGKIYLTASGMQVYDVTTPSNPKILGIIDTPHALGLTIDTNYIYVADKEEGLIVIPKK